MRETRQEFRIVQNPPQLLGDASPYSISGGGGGGVGGGDQEHSVL